MMNGIYDIAVLLCNSQHAFAHHFWNLRGVVRTPTGYTLWCEPVFVIFFTMFPFFQLFTYFSSLTCTNTNYNNLSYTKTGF